MKHRAKLQSQRIRTAHRLGGLLDFDVDKLSTEIKQAVAPLLKEAGLRPRDVQISITATTDPFVNFDGKKQPDGCISILVDVE